MEIEIECSTRNSWDTSRIISYFLILFLNLMTSNKYHYSNIFISPKERERKKEREKEREKEILLFHFVTRHYAKSIIVSHILHKYLILHSDRIAQHARVRNSKSISHQNTQVRIINAIYMMCRAYTQQNQTIHWIGLSQCNLWQYIFMCCVGCLLRQTPPKRHP